MKRSVYDAHKLSFAMATLCFTIFFTTHPGYSEVVKVNSTEASIILPGLDDVTHYYIFNSHTNSWQIIKDPSSPSYSQDVPYFSWIEPFKSQRDINTHISHLEEYLKDHLAGTTDSQNPLIIIQGQMNNTDKILVLSPGQALEYRDLLKLSLTVQDSSDQNLHNEILTEHHKFFAQVLEKNGQLDADEPYILIMKNTTGEIDIGHHSDGPDPIKNTLLR